MPRGLAVTAALAVVLLTSAKAGQESGHYVQMPAASGTSVVVDLPIDPPSGESKPINSGTADAVHQHTDRWAGDPKKFFEGAFVGLLAHEAGHYVGNCEVGSDPFLRSVSYGPIPFFTIEPQRPLTRREHYITASAGFDAQHIINEWLLTKHPNLRKEDKPFLKGMATFNFWLTVGYATTAFAGSGPDERDTKGMADALGWNERWVGVLILAPTALDAYRYNHPDAKWAKTASRLTKLFIIGLATKAHD